MKEISKTKAINNFITVKRLPPVREGLVHVVETAQKSFYGIITSVGEGVKNKHIIKNRLILCNAAGCLTINGIHFLKEEDILMSKLKVWRPLGNKILVQRMNSEFKIGSIILPDCRKQTDQTLHCVCISNGILDHSLFDSGLNPGDTIRLVSWSKDIKEVEIDDNFYLIIKPSDILYKYEGDDSTNRIIN